LSILKTDIIKKNPALRDIEQDQVLINTLIKVCDEVYFGLILSLERERERER